MSTSEYLMARYLEYIEKNHRDPNAVILSYGMYLGLERETEKFLTTFHAEKNFTPQFCGCEIIIVEDIGEPVFVCRKEMNHETHR